MVNFHSSIVDAVATASASPTMFFVDDERAMDGGRDDRPYSKLTSY